MQTVSISLSLSEKHGDITFSQLLTCVPSYLSQVTVPDCMHNDHYRYFVVYMTEQQLSAPIMIEKQIFCDMLLYSL